MEGGPLLLLTLVLLFLKCSGPHWPGAPMALLHPKPPNPSIFVMLLVRFPSPNSTNTLWHVLIWWWPGSAGLIAGVNDLGRSFPTSMMLWFYDNFLCWKISFSFLSFTCKFLPPLTFFFFIAIAPKFNTAHSRTAAWSQPMLLCF